MPALIFDYTQQWQRLLEKTAGPRGLAPNKVRMLSRTETNARKIDFFSAGGSRQF